MDEVRALQKAVKDLYFEKAVEDVVGQIREQEINAMNFATVNTRLLAK